MALAVTYCMGKTSPAYVTPLRSELEQLSAFTPTAMPVLSLYLDLSPNQHGRDEYDPFVRKVLADHRKTFPLHTVERASFDADAHRIAAYLSDELQRSSNGLALYACFAADEYFRAIQLNAPFDSHVLFVGTAPQVYPLARLVDQYSRYAALLLDTHHARIFVFSLGAVEHTAELTGVKTRRHDMGGWSQARFQRHVENFHIHHVKDVVDALDRIVTAEHIDHVIVSADEVALPLLRDQLPTHLANKIVDVLHVEHGAPDAEVLDRTLTTMRRKHAEIDAARAEELIDAWRAHGRGVAGPDATLQALSMGQVDELLIASRLPETTVVEEAVKKAHHTGARVRFIDDPQLLEPVGGVGALLRFTL